MLQPALLNTRHDPVAVAARCRTGMPTNTCGTNQCGRTMQPLFIVTRVIAFCRSRTLLPAYVQDVPGKTYQPIAASPWWTATTLRYPCTTPCIAPSQSHPAPCPPPAMPMPITFRVHPRFQPRCCLHSLRCARLPVCALHPSPPPFGPRTARLQQAHCRKPCPGICAGTRVVTATVPL